MKRSPFLQGQVLVKWWKYNEISNYPCCKVSLDKGNSHRVITRTQNSCRPFFLFCCYCLFVRAYGGCDWSAENVHFPVAPDPTLAFAGGPCCPTLHFVIAFWIMITFCTFLYLKNFRTLKCIYKLPHILFVGDPCCLALILYLLFGLWLCAFTVIWWRK
jgi:hypothetical protein